MDPTFQAFFKLAMKRDVPALRPEPGSSTAPILRLNLGPGYSPIAEARNLGWPEWDGDREPIPYSDETFDVVYAFHFLEHLADPARMLAEIQRVLRPGGLLNLCVPYYSSQLQAMDLSHRHAFCEDTWKVLMANTGYQPHDRTVWRLQVGFNLICGIAERNLCLLTQMEKL